MAIRPAPCAGAFPGTDPLTYVLQDPAEARAALSSGPYQPISTWYHATYDYAFPSIIHTGLIPSCWWDGDMCAVFGYDTRASIPMYRRSGWILELNSPALLGPVKAWWVAPTAITGAWHDGIFYPVHAMLSVVDPTPLPATRHGCSCSLAELTTEQQELWRSSWA